MAAEGSGPGTESTGSDGQQESPQEIFPEDARARQAKQARDNDRLREEG